MTRGFRFRGKVRVVHDTWFPARGEGACSPWHVVVPYHYDVKIVRSVICRTHPTVLAFFISSPSIPSTMMMGCVSHPSSTHNCYVYVCGYKGTTFLLVFQIFSRLFSSFPEIITKNKEGAVAFALILFSVKAAYLCFVIIHRADKILDLQIWQEICWHVEQ